MACAAVTGLARITATAVRPFCCMNPSALIPPAPAAASLRAPSLRRRMACWLYEGTLMFGVVVLPGLIFGIATNTRHALDNRHALQALLFGVLALYFGYFWVKGQTLPMKTWKLRVVNQDGRPLRPIQAVLRYCAAWPSVCLLGIGLLWAVIDKDKQFLHDRIAGTRITPAG